MRWLRWLGQFAGCASLCKFAPEGGYELPFARIVQGGALLGS
jgi:hypothetical protein